VQRLFAQVTDMVDDESSFVVVLIGASSRSRAFLEQGKR